MLKEPDAGWDSHLGLAVPLGRRAVLPLVGLSFSIASIMIIKSSHFLKRNVVCVHVGFPFTKAVCCGHFNGMTVDFCGVCSSVVVNSKLFSAEKLIVCGLFPVAVRFAQGNPLQTRQ